MSEDLDEFKQQLLKQMKGANPGTVVTFSEDREVVPFEPQTLPLEDKKSIICRQCGRIDKFCQRCGTISEAYRMYDDDHNTLQFEAGRWVIKMDGVPLCIIRPVHIKAILESVKVADRCTLLEQKQYDMFIEEIVKDIENFVTKMELNRNMDRLKSYREVQDLILGLKNIRGTLSFFTKLNDIKNAGKIDD